ncbi:folate-binding protein [Hyphomonas sp.]|jgi:folate-binding protein YgfZ|uniref:CAF17-like 4Fe-4S cluster assembly/insertion protein YgfZ n=1 Tax=Hyphomonas sp. TaxID=87 RepID=UPI0025C51B4A|nr:folate-binding protein [Hyphomonas sp.]
MHRLPNRAILRLEGSDTLALLERTVTHTVAGWEAGVARYGALLTPQGKVIADYIAHRTPEGVLIDVHEDAAEDLVKRLKMFRLRSAVEIVRDEALVPVIDAEGVADPRTGKLPHRSVATAREAEAPLPRWDALAISAGIPEWGRDFRAAEVFPTDINMDLMDGIDYKKGCFVGQEVASRMKRKALIRKRTVRVKGKSLASGAQVRAGANLLGTVTSAADGEGLALIRTDRLAKAIEAKEPVTVNDAAAEIDGAPWLIAEVKALLEAPSDE